MGSHGGQILFASRGAVDAERDQLAQQKGRGFIVEMAGHKIRPSLFVMQTDLNAVGAVNDFGNDGFKQQPFVIVPFRHALAGGAVVFQFLFEQPTQRGFFLVTVDSSLFLFHDAATDVGDFIVWDDFVLRHHLNDALPVHGVLRE